MKRCPECLFIYPDSDTRCDFDNTPLIVVDEAELEAATTKPKPSPKPKRKATNDKPAARKPKPATKKRSRKVTALTAIVALFLGIAAFVVYYRSNHRSENVSQAQSTPITSEQQIAALIPSP